MTKKQPFYLSPDQPAAKQKILSEALRLFTANGYAATTIRDIAQASGYTNPALYKHYASKEDLALDLFMTCYAEIVARIDNAVAKQETFRDQLHALLQTYAKVYEEAPEAALYVADQLPHLWAQVPKKMQARTQVTQIREILQKGRKEGKVDKKRPLELLVGTVIGVINQTGRMLYFDALKPPATRYTSDLLVTLEKALA